MIFHNARKKPRRPPLNFHSKDDAIDYYKHDTRRMEDELQLDRQELETIDAKARDGSETSAEGDTNHTVVYDQETQLGTEGDTGHTEEYDQETQLGPESDASEDDVTLDYQIVNNNIADGFAHFHVFSLEDGEEESTPTPSQCEWEWEIMSGEQSVQSYGEDECMFTYKDAVQVQMQTNRNPASSPKVNILYKTTRRPIEIRPLGRTFPTRTTRGAEEKEEENNAHIDAYFEYDAFKGGRGRNWLKHKRHAGRNPHVRRSSSPRPCSVYKYKRERGRAELKKNLSWDWL